jgi:hypothetical protein
MDSSSACQSELLVAVNGAIEYKREGTGVLKPSVEGFVKKPYQKPKLRVYGDIRTMTMANVAGMKSDHKMVGPLTGMTA